MRVSGGVVIGFDLTAALAAAGALGIDPVAVVELLPVIEARMVEAAHARVNRVPEREWE